jgi:hypothetical protein
MMSFWDTFEPNEVVHTFPVGDGEYTWTIRAPSFGQELALAKRIQLRESRTSLDVAVDELWLTFGGCTIPAKSSPSQNPGAHDFIPALEIGAPRDQVEAVLSQLPWELVRPLWNRVKEVAPNWGPDFPGEGEPGR